MRPVDDIEILLIAEPAINTSAMLDYLHKVGGEGWIEKLIIAAQGEEDSIPPSEALIEFAGRLCYKSWQVGLNPNVTKIREDRAEYLRNILRAGHGSVLEHASFTFVLHNVSRVLTAELNRHRAGVAISEQSLRYVRLTDIAFRFPPALNIASREFMRIALQDIEEAIDRITKSEFVPDLGFHQKKVLTSAMRRIAPMGMATEMVWTANVRAIRHVIEMRSAPGAEEEIRVFAHKLHEIMSERSPLLFGDYERDDEGALVTKYRKV